MNPTTIVERLACGTDMAVVFWLVSERSGPSNGLLFLWILSRVRMWGAMLRSANHCRNSPFPYVVSAATDSGSRPCHA